MFAAFVNAFRIPELRKKIFFTLIVLFLYRLGVHVVIPGVDSFAVSNYFKTGGGGILGLIDMFTGGAFRQASVLALGIMPYISASIIIQLLTVVFPYLKKLTEEGEQGYRKINQYTRYGTILICLVQALFTSKYLVSIPATDAGPVVPSPDMMFYFIAILSMTTGTTLAMWLGEQITENGIGNGISLLIFIGIVARLPISIGQTYQSIKMGEINIISIAGMVLFVLAITAIVTIVTMATRKITVQYAKKVVGRRIYSRPNTFIPMRLNASGVIPVIFASALLQFPVMIFSMIGGANPTPFLMRLRDFVRPGAGFFIFMQAVLIAYFTFFYTAIQYNPTDLADNIKKQGGFIPGIRPGKATADFMTKILSRLMVADAIYLVLISTIPDIVIKFTRFSQQLIYLFGGTSLLIIVGVVLDTMRQVESHLMMRHYEGFMQKGKLKGRFS